MMEYYLLFFWYLLELTELLTLQSLLQESSVSQEVSPESRDQSFFCPQSPVSLSVMVPHPSSVCSLIASRISQEFPVARPASPSGQRPGDQLISGAGGSVTCQGEVCWAWAWSCQGSMHLPTEETMVPRPGRSEGGSSLQRWEGEGSSKGCQVQGSGGGKGRGEADDPQGQSWW